MIQGDIYSENLLEWKLKTRRPVGTPRNGWLNGENEVLKAKPDIGWVELISLTKSPKLLELKSKNPKLTQLF